MKYYKYMPFGPHTRLSLYMLLKENSVFFADKKVLNDPTDCNPNIEIDSDDASIHAYAERIAYEGLDIYPPIIRGTASHLASNETDSPSINENFGAWRFINSNQRHLKAGISLHHLFAKTVVQFHIEEARVFSMSKTALEPRMWAHYSDSHRGICLEFEIEDTAKSKFRIGDVEYTTKRPTILSSEVLSIPNSTDTVAKTLLYNKMFLTKSNGWAYEQESRLYIPKAELSKGFVTLDLPEGEFRKATSIKLTGIIGGLNVNTENFSLVNDLHKSLSNSRNKVSFHKITAKPNSYDLDIQDDDEVPF